MLQQNGALCAMAVLTTSPSVEQSQQLYCGCHLRSHADDCDHSMDIRSEDAWYQAAGAPDSASKLLPH